MSDIVINVVSDFIFAVLILLIVWLLNGLFYYGRLGRAQQFFGFDRQAPIKIYVSQYITDLKDSLL